MKISIEQIVKDPEAFSADDAAVIENILNYYMTCNEELKQIMRSNAANRLQQMAGVGLFTKKLMGPHGRAIITETANGLFASDPEDYGVGWDIRRDGQFSTELLKTIYRSALFTSKVLVVGAHIGTLAIPLAKKYAYVAAIEANPNTFWLLEMNLRLNNVTNCELFNIAANDKEETLKFMLNRANSGGSKRKPVNDHYIYNYDEPQEIEVSGVALDNYFTRRDFDVVLMDIEGSEYFALKGMQDILSKTKVLIMEFIPHHLRNISNVTVDKLLALLPGFTTLRVPSLNKTVRKEEFAGVLNYMYERGLEDGGLMFGKY
jgi:FkbM family methyltransferase